jgi:hypothetical protein
VKVPLARCEASRRVFEIRDVRRKRQTRVRRRDRFRRGQSSDLLGRFGVLPHPGVRHREIDDGGLELVERRKLTTGDVCLHLRRREESVGRCCQIDDGVGIVRRSIAVASALEKFIRRGRLSHQEKDRKKRQRNRQSPSHPSSFAPNRISIKERAQLQHADATAG